MVERNRAWLRTFLHLDARADAGVTVPPRDVERQEDTVLRALELLETQPGVVLADEVGMGKTYEALGVIAAQSHENPGSRTLILTPGPDLNVKWTGELEAFGDARQPMFRGFVGKFREANSLGELVARLNDSAIVVAPVSVFAGNRGLSDQSFLLSTWADAKGFAGNQLAAMLRRYREGAQRVDTQSARFLDAFDWSTVEPVLRRVLKAHAATSGSLDALLEDGGYDAFHDAKAVNHALADLRFRLLQQLVPTVDLMVVDEAHKLKNPDSVRSTGVRTVFDKRLKKALFLTATPFQLSVQELSAMFDLFAMATTAPADLAERSKGLLDVVRTYQEAYAAFEGAWRRMDGVAAADFAAWFADHPTLVDAPEDPNLALLVSHARRLLELKRDQIEPGFRSWMIRSLREDKRAYRRARPQRLKPTGAGSVPFLLYERFIAQLFRSNQRTHKAAVQINMVSSYGAAREGALLKDEVRDTLDEDAEAYRKLLQGVVGELRDGEGGHPKVDHVVRDALGAAQRGEKTLIFCARTESLKEIRRDVESLWNAQILEKWRAVYPDADVTDIFDEKVEDARKKGRHSTLQTRFHRGQDALYLALRERYVDTLLDAEFAHANLDDIVRRANVILRGQGLPKSQAERMDWSVVKRCVEHATALALVDAGRGHEFGEDALRRLTDPSFVALGFDLEADELESVSEGKLAAEWQIGADDARLVLPHPLEDGPPSSGNGHTPHALWSLVKAPLFDVPADLRVRTVERLARYLTSRYVPFLPDLLAFAKLRGLDLESIESRALLPLVDSFWTSSQGRPWCQLISNFLHYASRLDDSRRRKVLDDIDGIAIVRHTVDGESRERLREAFNTPLYPMILVANEVMQEGLDLHHNCRRVIHHDLAWNPAQLEQRVGRVDRLGSLVQRLRAKSATAETKLEISLPLVAHTIDERLERTVRLRERWLEFLLGAPPNFEEHGLADEAAQPLPEAFARALQVHLGP